MITREQFRLQVDRLEDTFGERHFPDQRVHMIWDYVRDLDYPSVIRIVDFFIRESKFGPLPVHFLEAAKAEEKRVFQENLQAAVNEFDSPFQTGLKAFLEREYPGCKTLNQAVQVQVLRNQIARAQNGEE